jgi:hypothetical protein
VGDLGERTREQQVPGGGGGQAARGSEHGGPAAAQLGSVEDIVVNERGHVQQLHRGRSGHELIGIAGPAQEDEDRAQSLATGGQRAVGMDTKRAAVPGADLREPRLRSLEQARELRAARPQHRPELRLSGVHDARVPE